VGEVPNDRRRRFTRVKPSGLVSSRATIVIDKKIPAIECSVIDLSAGGACLQVPDPNAIPKRFELVHAGTRKKCNVVWKARNRLGVSF
jgi:PilZ domain